MALVKWIVYCALLLLVIFAVWRNRYELLSAISNLGQWLLDFWHNLFGGKAGDADEAGEAEGPKKTSEAALCRFHRSVRLGMAGSYSPAELVRYTFEAVEAWAREQGHPRQADQTPHEFARCLASDFAWLDEDARQLADFTLRPPMPRSHCRRQTWPDCRTCG